MMLWIKGVTNNSHSVVKQGGRGGFCRYLDPHYQGCCSNLPFLGIAIAVKGGFCPEGNSTG